MPDIWVGTGAFHSHGTLVSVHTANAEGDLSLAVSSPGGAGSSRASIQLYLLHLRKDGVCSDVPIFKTHIELNSNLD